MPDSVPNYLFTDAAGKVFAVFPGGITVQAGTAPAFLQPIGRRVMWTKDGSPSGAMVAELYAYDDASGHTLVSAAYLDRATDPTRQVATASYGAAAIDGATTGQSQLVTTAITNGDSTVQAYAGTHVNTILENHDRSDFARLHATYRSVLVSGGVTAAGARNYGVGFSVVRTGVGIYQITWDSPFPSDYAFSFGSDQGAPLDVLWTGAKLNSPTVHTLQGGVHADSFFNFIAMWCEV